MNHKHLLLLLAALLFFSGSNCLAEPFTLAWDPPAEGPTPEGYRIWWSSIPDSYSIDRSIDVGNVFQYQLDLPYNTYLICTAYIDDKESGASNQVIFTQQGVEIMPPTGGQITYEWEDVEPPVITEIFRNNMEHITNHMPDVGIGQVIVNGSPQLVIGVEGNAVLFTSPQDNFTINPLNVPWEGGEIEFDFRPTIEFIENSTNFIAGGTPPVGYFRIQGNFESAMFRTGLAGGVSGLAIVPWTPVVGQWSHFRVRWENNGLIEIQVNGVRATGIPAQSMGGALTSFTIGNIEQNSDYARGAIDNFVVIPLEE